MKKIEERMVAAIKSEKPFRESNTEVLPVWSGDSEYSVVLGVKVFLFGNCIAQITPSEKTYRLAHVRVEYSYHDVAYERYFGWSHRRGILRYVQNV